MKITVINGTEKKGVTWKLKEIFLEHFKDTAEITEFYLPKDCPSFCTGCTTCLMNGEDKCKDAPYIQKIEKALLEADLLVFTSPAYVFHTTGAMKAMLDHFAYRWMPHRPAKELFGKRAVIITQCLGSGKKSTAKDIKDSLSWWGITKIKCVSFKLMTGINWEEFSDKKKNQMTAKLTKLAVHMSRINYAKPARAGIAAKAKFLIVRMLQTGLYKDNPEYRDAKYWKENGWLESERPWKKRAEK